MLTGTLSLNITIEAKDQKTLEDISCEIRQALMKVKGVTDTEEVDADISDNTED